MRRALPILTALLAVQLVLAAVLHMGGDEAQPVSGGPLAMFDRDGVDAVRIASSDDSALRLERAEEGWRVPASDGFPADPARVGRLLDQLEGMTAELPVATSQSARERFRVASDHYERRIDLVAGGERQTTIYFGESAGASRVYARAEGANAIHEVEFAVWQTTAEAGEWLDSSVPAVERASIRQVSLPDFRLRRDAGGGPWHVVAGDAPEPAKPQEASSLLERLTAPEIEGAERAEAPADEPALAYSVTTEGGETIRFRYYSGEEATAYLHRSDQRWSYELPQSRLTALSETGPKQLLADESSGGDSGGAASQAATGPGKAGAS